MTQSIDSILLEGVFLAFRELGSVGWVVLGLIFGSLLLPWVLRILSFFRKGGTGGGTGV